MKQASLILNIVLLVAVGVLYFLHFKGRPNEEPGAAPVSIAYVNSDSLFKNYDFYKQSEDSMTKKRATLEKELEEKGKSLENEIRNFQQKVQTGALSAQQAQETEKSLMKKQQDFFEYKNSLGQQLAEEQQKMNEKVYGNIVEYIKKVNKEKNYNFVLGFSKGGGILYANDSLDITKDVLKGLNAEAKGK